MKRAINWFMVVAFAVLFGCDGLKSTNGNKCTADIDCISQKCDTSAGTIGTCIGKPDGAACASPGECTGKQCDLVTHQCMEQQCKTPCKGSNVCLDGVRCTPPEGFSNWSDCLSFDRVCLSLVCGPDGLCAPREVGAFCGEDGECDTDSGHKCVAGVCQSDFTCTTACPVGQVCTAGSCNPVKLDVKESCSADDNCSTDYCDKRLSQYVCRANPATTTACTSFTYTSWGACQSNSTQSRYIATQSPTGCTGGTPVLTQSCTYVPPANACTSFTYNAWGACQSDSTQSRTIATQSPSGCAGGTPVLTQSCTFVPPTTLKDFNAACSAGAECRSGFCNSGVCGPDNFPTKVVGGDLKQWFNKAGTMTRQSASSGSSENSDPSKDETSMITVGVSAASDCQEKTTWLTTWTNCHSGISRGLAIWNDGRPAGSSALALMVASAEVNVSLGLGFILPHVVLEDPILAQQFGAFAAPQ